MASHRRRVLDALDITPWVLRAPTTPPVVETVQDAASDGPSLTRCVVVLPAMAETRAMDLLGRALSACGAELARAGRIRVAEGVLHAPVPHAPVYLVFGQAQAHALGRELPAQVMGRAHIALADEPTQVLTSGEGKRRLWSALRQVRRALATSRDS